MEISLKKSQIVRFESVGNGLGGQKILRGATKHGLRGSNAKTKKYLRQRLGTAKKANLPNTCLIWTSVGLFKWHWPADHEYINFLAVGALWAEILSQNFRRNSKMAAADRQKL